MNQKIIYTKTDEAPALATVSLLPVINAFAKTAGIEIETKDISLAGRILAAFPEFLFQNQQVPDDLAELGELVKKSETIIIKLPNISAAVPQLKSAINELQGKGFRLPDYPEEPKNKTEKDIKNRYDKIKGSAVNPVLREGNSDRRAPQAVKNYARKHPHPMGAWSSESKTRVASMKSGDFYGSERSVVFPEEGKVRAELINESGRRVVLIDELRLQKGEILDSAVMSRIDLRKFIKEQIAAAREQGILFSVHLKATMMKISDPVIFGHVVSIFFEDLFRKYGDVFKNWDSMLETG